MPGFWPENPGVIKRDVIPEIRRLHFVEHVTISDLAKQFKLSRPTIRKHPKTVEEPVYPTRQHQPHLKLCAYLEQLTTWLDRCSERIKWCCRIDSNGIRHQSECSNP